MKKEQKAYSPVFFHTAAAVLIAAAVLGIYAQSLGFDFINLDDGVYVTQNPMVQEGLSAKGAARAFTTLHGGFWIPMTWISLMADQSLFGGGAWGFHLTNMLLHLMNSLLVLWVLSFLTKSFRLSLTAALIFAVHPLHVESVCWISERKDVLFAFFFLLAMGAHGRYAQTRKRVWAAGVFLAGFLSLASKPMAATLPVLLLALDYWPLHRFSREKLFPLALEKAPLAFMCLIFGLVTLYAQNLYQGMQSLETVPLAARLGGAVYAYGVYTTQSLWPFDLGVFYPHAGMDLPVYKAAAAGAFFAALTGAAWKLRKKIPCLWTGWFFFCHKPASCDRLDANRPAGPCGPVYVRSAAGADHGGRLDHRRAGAIEAIPWQANKRSSADFHCFSVRPFLDPGGRMEGLRNLVQAHSQGDQKQLHGPRVPGFVISRQGASEGGRSGI